MDKKNVTGAEGQNGLFASAVYDKDRNEYIVKVANTSSGLQELNIKLAGLKKKDVITGVTAQTLSTKDLDSENTLEEPNKIVPSMKKFAMEEKADWTTVIEPNTFSVYHFKKQ